MSRHSITIGNFDGVHRGHAALIEAARRSAGPEGRVTALVFDPHPATVIRPERAPARLSTFDERVQHLRALGADAVGRLDPTDGMLQRSPESFVAWLVAEYGPTTVLEGSDFRFGRGRAGDVDTLASLGSQAGFDVVVVPVVEVALTDHLVVPASSTRIRQLLAQGRVQDAGRLLGRPYAVQGTVRDGAKLGRTIGIPTANVAVAEHLLPEDGVYAGRATDPSGDTQVAAISLGTKPTFDGADRTLEVHLVDWDGPTDDYGWTCRVQFGDRIRDQIRFDGVESLVAQLRRDIDRIRRRATRDPIVAAH